MEALAGVWETSPGGSVRVGTERVTGLGIRYTRIVAGDMEALAGVWEHLHGSVRVGTERVTARIRVLTLHLLLPVIWRLSLVYGRHLQPGLGYKLYTRIVAGDMEALAGVWETSPGGSVRVGTERVTARIRVLTLHPYCCR
ncbi:hypothetical protein J6590_058402 [Homalodisca vitripennis]|nr:hypothetical protein J6590_058402 [Homalodisca vitripennis]